MHDPKGYYQLLNIDVAASQEDVKKSYRGLMKQYHPDINSSPEAAELSKQINEAYSVLSDEQLRREYDSPTVPPEFSGFGGFSGFPDEIFQFFNFGHNAQQRANSDLNLDVTINSEELFTELDKITVTYKIRNFCSHCNGVGYSNWETCPGCDGKGKIIENRGDRSNFMQFITPCGFCGGTGKKVIDVCKECEGFSGKEESKQIYLPNDSSVYFKTLKFPQQGNKDVNVDMPPGDLYLRINPAINGAMIDQSTLNVIIDKNIDALNLMIEGAIELDGINDEKHQINLKYNNTTYTVDEKGIPIVGSTKKRSDLIFRINPLLKAIDDEEIKEVLSKYIAEGNKTQ